MRTSWLRCRLLSSAVQPGQMFGGLAGPVILYCRNTRVGSSSGSRGGPPGPHPSEEAGEVKVLDPRAEALEDLDPFEVQDPRAEALEDLDPFEVQGP